MAGRRFDPAQCLPSAEAIRRRIADIQTEARRLGILLRTAEELERDQQAVTAGESVADHSRGLAHAG